MSAASSLFWVVVAGPFYSQESTVLARSAPPSVDFSALAERDLRGWGLFWGPLPLSLFLGLPVTWQGVLGGAPLCLLAVCWVACPASRVSLSLHDPFAVSWASALSSGPFTLSFLPSTVSAVPVVVFRPLLGPSGSLSFLTEELMLFWPPPVPQ